MSELFDCNPAHRTSGEWRVLLGRLVESLAAHAGLPFRPTSWFVHDDQPGHASSSNSVDIRAAVWDAAGLEACGVLCISINFGEAVWASCDLLLFASGRRIKGPDGMELVALSYEDGTWSGGWTSDEFGEWESQTDNGRWQDA